MASGDFHRDTPTCKETLDCCVASLKHCQETVSWLSLNTFYLHPFSRSSGGEPVLTRKPRGARPSVPLPSPLHLTQLPSCAAPASLQCRPGSQPSPPPAGPVPWLRAASRRSSHTARGTAAAIPATRQRPRHSSCPALPSPTLSAAALQSRPWADSAQGGPARLGSRSQGRA